jgi:hypothetical protein
MSTFRVVLTVPWNSVSVQDRVFRLTCSCTMLRDDDDALDRQSFKIFL